MGEPPDIRDLGSRTSDDAREFKTSPYGNGKFGRWIVDSAGLPAYAYELDQDREAKTARYPNTEGLDRRDHWHQIGNDRITALAYNDGIIELYLADRGGVFLNRSEVWDDVAPLSPIGLIHQILRAFFHWRDKRRARRIVSGWSKTASPRGDPKPVPPGCELPYSPNTYPQASVGSRPRNPSETRFAFSGGYSYLDDGTEAWATAYCYRPPDANATRVFGMAYFDTSMTYRNIRSTRHVYAPYGNVPMLVVEEKLENLGPDEVTLKHYEYWDINIHQLKLQWFRTGTSAPIGDDERRELNNRFDVAITEKGGVLRFHQTRRDTVPLFDDDEGTGRVDRTPLDVFLADLKGPRATSFTNKLDFFGDGGAERPDAVIARRDPRPDAPLQDIMPYCMVMRHDNISLPPGGSIDLCHAYGALQPGQSLNFLDAYRQDSWFTQTLQEWKTHVVGFTSTDDVTDNVALQREIAWHSYNLLSATVHSEYYNTHYVTQGSAYLYLHGADGAPRDQSLFTLPLIYIRPDLARNTLRLLMRLTHAGTGGLPYSFAGSGYHSAARGIHAEPSDLDLFFLLALFEYIAATGHRAFLNESIPFYNYPHCAPPQHPAFVTGDTVFDHVRCAVIHLLDTVGTGENGLIRIGDGDWSDGVVFSTLLQRRHLKMPDEMEQTKRHGESVPNTQMALYVLPRIATLIAGRDPELAQRITDWLPGLRNALKIQLHETTDNLWYSRAILRDAANIPFPVDADRINLEAQVWALIGNTATEPGQEEKLIDTINRVLDTPSAVGAMMTSDGAVWPAISQLLTWGYTRSCQDRAWNSLKKHTFASHAEQFPDKWNNIWTGPDGIEKSGWAWASPVTPMTDFPAMNANQNAMFLLALLRVCGIEPSSNGDGLVIAPKSPPESFRMDTELLRLEVQPGSIEGEYRELIMDGKPVGKPVLHVVLPDAATEITVSMNGVSTPIVAQKPGEITLLLPATPRAVPFAVRWQATSR